MADGNKNKKYGRNAAQCKAYEQQGRREINKRRKMERHLRRFPTDEQCANAMRSIESKRINALKRAA